MPTSQPVITPNNRAAALKKQPGQSRLDIWLKTLPKNPLPIDDKIAYKIRLLTRDIECDSHKLAELIKQDPILCLKLFHCAERGLKKAEDSAQQEVQNLVHLLGLIGLNKLEDIIQNSKRKDERTEIPEGFREILSASLFSAHLAADLLATKHGSNTERFFLPSLFFNAPLWLMWIAAPKIMTQGQNLASREKQSYIALSVKKLGFRLPDLLTRTHQFIHLPEITLKALSINPTKDINFWAKAHRFNREKLKNWLDNDKSSKLKFYSIENGIFLINQYVIAIYLDWSGKHIRRQKKLLCHYLSIEEHELDNVVINLAINLDFPNHLQGLLTPINRLHGFHRDKHYNDPKEETNISKETKKIGLWLQAIRKSNSVDTALKNTLNALSKGANIGHCVIMSVSDNDIHTQYCHGFDQKSPIKNFHQDRISPKNLFNQLAKKPSCLSIGTEKLNHIKQSISPQFLQYCPLKPCGLSSFFYREKPKAIIYCDDIQWDQKKKLQFKAISRELTKTLEKL